jgi:ubiquinone/menaquinone biosynthesis C-methylase UbiE
MSSDLEPGIVWGNLAPRWDTSGAGWNTPVAERLVDLAGIEPGTKILDVGCGVGAASLPAARRTGRNGLVIGIDSAPEMVRRAWAEAEKAGVTNIMFDKFDAQDIPYAKETFDVVISSMVLGYLPWPGRAVKGWRDLLREGGTLAFSWVRAEDPAWVAVFDAVDAYIPQEHRWRAGRERWDEAEAEALLPPGMRVRTVTEPVVTQFNDPQHFWASTWTQAAALSWAYIPPPERAAAQESIRAPLAALAAPDGSLKRTRTVCYTLARLEAGPGPGSGNGPDLLVS